MSVFTGFFSKDLVLTSKVIKTSNATLLFTSIYNLFSFIIRFCLPKKQTSTLFNLYSAYEKRPEEFLVETDIVSYFHHNNLDISKSYYRINGISKVSNKKSFAFKVFHFCNSKLQQRVILKEEASIHKKIEYLLDSLGEFLRVFDPTNKISQIPSLKPNFEIGYTKPKDELFRQCY